MIQIDLGGRVAVVTGGSSGIGLATVMMFAQAGASVVMCGRDADRLRSAEQAVRTAHPEAKLLAAQCDVLQADQVERLAHSVGDTYGRVDMLINNAGQARMSTFADTTDAAWREELELKYFSIIRPTRAFLPMLERAEAASIVCVNSLLSVEPEPLLVATSSARAGVLSLTKSLAVELAPKRIRVNSILLGLVDSGQWRRRFAAQATPGSTWEQYSSEVAARREIRLGRLGRPEEAAAAIFFLASPASSYTTGSHIDVSGGLAKHV